MNIPPVIAAWVFIVIATYPPQDENELERIRNDQEIQMLAKYLRENREEIDRYMLECVLEKEDS